MSWPAQNIECQLVLSERGEIVFRLPIGHSAMASLKMSRYANDWPQDVGCFLEIGMDKMWGDSTYTRTSPVAHPFDFIVSPLRFQNI